MKTLTPDLIERRVERMTGHLDRVFLDRQIDQKTYDIALQELRRWAEHQYAVLDRRKQFERNHKT
jgi:hypothetical protein